MPRYREKEEAEKLKLAGKAEYLGGAVYLKDGANNERAKMTATADFDKKTVAIMIPNLLGNICDWEKISFIAKKYKLVVIGKIVY